MSTEETKTRSKKRPAGGHAAKHPDPDRATETRAKPHALDTHARPAEPGAPVEDRRELDRTRTAPDHARPALPDEPMDALDPDAVGGERYRIDGLHARGGLGRVLRAHDRQLGRDVAVKEILEPSAEAEARFLREAMITGRLEHPGIVPVYEIGRWDDGTPFYAMKMIEGRTLKDAIARAGDLGQRLELLPAVLTVAETIAFAHSRGVVHRDLKPSNVVLGDYGETLVVDWGIARATTDADTSADDAAPARPTSPLEDDALTVTGDVLGTPAYMPPEQARGQKVDARADVYALGAMLYHLLSGRPPYRARSSGEILSKVLHDHPPDLRHLEPHVPGDLEAIVDKAMARSPTDRYASATQLATDLRRFQAGQLVTAYRYTRRELWRRWLARHKRLLLPAAFAATAIIAVTAVSFQRVSEQRDRAEIERHEAEKQRNRAIERTHELTVAQARSAAESDPTKTIASLKQLPHNSPHWATAKPLVESALDRGVANAVYDVSEAEIRALASDESGRFLIVGSREQGLHVIDMDKDIVNIIPSEHSASFAVIDQVVYVAGPRGYKVYELSDPTMTEQPSPTGRARTWHDVPTGLIQVVSGGDHVIQAKSGRAFVWAWPDGEAKPYWIDHGKRAAKDDWDRQGPDLAVTEDGIMWGISTEDGVERLRRTDLETGTHRTFAIKPRVLRILATAEFDKSGFRSLIREYVGTARVGKLSASPHGVAFTLENAGGAVAILYWRDAEDALEVVSWETPRGVGVSMISQLELSPRGNMLAAIGLDGSFRVWPLDDPEQARGFRLRGNLHALAWSKDGRYVAAGGDDARSLIVDTTDWTTSVRLGHEVPISAIAFTPDGNRLITADQSGEVRVWKTAATIDREYTSIYPCHRRPYSEEAQFLEHEPSSPSASQVLLTRDTSTYVAVCSDGNVLRINRKNRSADIVYKIIQPDDGALKKLPFLKNEIAVSVTGHTLAIPLDDRIAIIDGEQTLDISVQGTDEIAMTPSGDRLFVAAEGGIYLWSRGNDTLEHIHDGPTSVYGLSVSDDGERLAILSWSRGFLYNIADDTIREFDYEANGSPHPAVFSRNGRWLFVGIGPWIDKIDTSSLAVQRLRGHRKQVIGMWLSAHERLTTIDQSGSLRVWSSNYSSSRDFSTRGFPAAFGTTPDEDEIIILRFGREWTIRPRKIGAPLPAWLNSVTTAELDENDRPVTELKRPPEGSN